MSESTFNDPADALVVEFHRQHVAALTAATADAVVQAAMHAALFVALETLPSSEVSAWLRRLADQMDATDPAAPGAAH